MNVFASHASNASSENLQDIWARVLAGELRKPSSFSLRTLQFISILDKSLAETVERTVAASLNKSFVCHVAEYNRGNGYSDLITLSGVGFCQNGVSELYQAPGGVNKLGFSVCGKKMLTCHATHTTSFQIEGAAFTQVGLEIASIIDVDANMTYIFSLKEHLKAKTHKYISWTYSSAVMNTFVSLTYDVAWCLSPRRAVF